MATALKTIAKITVIEVDNNFRSYEYWCQNQDEVTATINYLEGLQHRQGIRIDIVVERVANTERTV
jgi:hypothetical protein